MRKTRAILYSCNICFNLLVNHLYICLSVIYTHMYLYIYLFFFFVSMQHVHCLFWLSPRIKQILSYLILYFQESALESARSGWPLMWKIRLASTTVFLSPPLPTIETVWHLLMFKRRPQVPRKVLVQSSRCCRSIGVSASRTRSSAKAMARTVFLL